MEAPPGRDLDKMTENETVKVFITNFYAFSQRDCPQPYTEDNDNYMEAMIKVLSKWQSAHRLEIDSTLEGSRANGRYWGHLIVDSLINMGRPTFLGPISKLFGQMANTAETELGALSLKDAKEYDEWGPLSWQYVQQMDHQFFTEASAFLARIKKEQQNQQDQQWEQERTRAMQAAFRQTPTPAGIGREGREAAGRGQYFDKTGGPSREMSLGGGSRRRRKPQKSDEDGEAIPPASKKKRGRPTVVLSGGMVGAPGSISLPNNEVSFGGLPTPDSAATPSLASPNKDEQSSKDRPENSTQDGSDAEPPN